MNILATFLVELLHRRQGKLVEATTDINRMIIKLTTGDKVAEGDHLVLVLVEELLELPM